MSTTQDYRWGGIVVDRTRTNPPATRVRARMWTESGQARYADLTEENLMDLRDAAAEALTHVQTDRLRAEQAKS